MRRMGLLSVVLSLVAAGCVSQAKHDAQLALARKLQEQLKQAQQESTDLKTKIGGLEGDIAKMNKALKGVQADTEKMKAGFASKMKITQKEFERKLREARKEADARAKMFRDLKNRLRKLIKAGNLSIRIFHGRLVLKLKSAVLFASGKAKLRKAGSNALKAIAAVLKTIRRKHFQVAGHTDNRPIRRAAYKNNWELSAARAVQVVTFLKKHGMNSRNLSAAGFSQYQPVARNSTPGGRRMNRRIEITLLPSIPSQLLR